jgi:hypothetical protein
MFRLAAHELIAGKPPTRLGGHSGLARVPYDLAADPGAGVLEYLDPGAIGVFGLRMP